MNLRMHKLLGICLTLLCATLGLNAQIDAKLVQKQWQDPAFVKSFLGSYGVLADYEPQIDASERNLFDQLVDLLQDKPEQAIELLESKINKDRSAAFDFILGNLYFQQSDLKQARSHYQRAIAKHPSFRRAYQNLGLLEVQSGNFQAATEALSQAMELGAVDGRAYGLLGYSHLALEQYYSAEIAYRQAMLMQPQQRDWQLGLVNCLLQTKRFAEGVALLDLLLKNEPDNADYWLLQSNAYLGLEQATEAAKNIELVRRMGQAKVNSLKLLGDIYINQHAPELALSAYLDAVKLAQSKDLDALIGAATALTQTGNYPQVGRLIQETRQHFTAPIAARSELKLLTLEAKVARAQGEHETALNLLNRIIERDTLNGDALIELANYYAEQGELAKAITRYQQAEKIEAYQRPALIAHAQTLVREQDYPAALPLLRKALQLQYDENLEAFTRRVKRAEEGI